MLPAVLAALPWVAPFFGMPRLASTSPNLTDVAPEDGVPVSVIIPARNEERSIGPAVESVLASVGVELEVIVLDDQSEDRTADVVREIAARDSRVMLEQAPPLPEGW